MPSEQPEVVTENGIGRTGRPEVSPATAKSTHEATTQSLLEQGDNVRQLEEGNALAVVAIDDNERLKDLEGVGKAKDMTGLNLKAERLVSPHRNSRVVYVRTIEEAAAKMAGEGRTWANTFFFVESTIRDRERESYDRLRNQAFVWNLNIPDNSLCSVTPLGFLMFSVKFNDFLTRIQNGSGDLDMEPLAEIILLNVGEEVTTENVRQVIDNVLRRIADNLATNKDPQQLLAAYSGYFSWNLPRIKPQNWQEVDDYFDGLEGVYSAV